MKRKAVIFIYDDGVCGSMSTRVQMDLVFLVSAAPIWHSFALLATHWAHIWADSGGGWTASVVHWAACAKVGRGMDHGLEVSIESHHS